MGSKLDAVLGNTVMDQPTKEIIPGKSVVVLNDSDTIAYRAAAAADGRTYTVNGRSFDYKKDILTYCAENKIPEEEITLEYFPDPIENVLHTVKQIIKSVKREMRETFKGKDLHYEYYHTHPENFRKEILPDYKISRDKQRRPYHLSSCKEYIERKHKAIVEPGYEADDLIGIRAYECAREGIDYVIVTNDKDLKTIPCKYNYDWTTGIWTEVCLEDAMVFFYAQCIAGDGTDDIPGIDGYGINKQGTGKAQKFIDNAARQYFMIDNPPFSLEQTLYFAAMDAWLEGGPGARGFLGCQPLEVIHENFIKSAQCLFICHEFGQRWRVPSHSHSNF